MAITDECPRATKCTSVCNLCYFNCDHMNVSIQTESNEEGRAEGFCNSCDAMLLREVNGDWEVIGYEFRGEYIRDLD